MEIDKEKTNKDAAAEINLPNNWTCSSLFGVDAALEHKDADSSSVVSLSMVRFTKSIQACNCQREKRSTVNILAKNYAIIVLFVVVIIT